MYTKVRLRIFTDFHYNTKSGPSKAAVRSTALRSLIQFQSMLLDGHLEENKIELPHHDAQGVFIYFYVELLNHS